MPESILRTVGSLLRARAGQLAALGALIVLGWWLRWGLLALGGFALVLIPIWASLVWMVSPRKNWRLSEDTQLFLSCVLLVAAIWLFPKLMEGNRADPEINLLYAQASLMFAVVALILLLTFVGDSWTIHSPVSPLIHEIPGKSVNSMLGIDAVAPDRIFNVFVEQSADLYSLERDKQRKRTRAIVGLVVIVLVMLWQYRESRDIEDVKAYNDTREWVIEYAAEHSRGGGCGTIAKDAFDNAGS